jgi:uncharacterized membrane protein YqhA
VPTNFLLRSAVPDRAAPDPSSRRVVGRVAGTVVGGEPEGGAEGGSGGAGPYTANVSNEGVTEERKRAGLLGRAMERARYVAAVPAVGMVLLSVVVVIWGVTKGYSVTMDIIDPPTEQIDQIGRLLEVTDLFLIGIVFLIFGVGIWELFVEDLEVPNWLTITSLSGLKDKLIDTLLLVLGVWFVQQALSRPDPDVLLRLAASIALVGGTLVLFRVLRPRERSGPAPGRAPDPVPSPAATPGTGRARRRSGT